MSKSTLGLFLLCLAGCAAGDPFLGETSQSAAGTMTTLRPWAGNQVDYYIDSTVPTSLPSGYPSCSSNGSVAPCGLSLFTRIKNSAQKYTDVTPVDFIYHSGLPDLHDGHQHLLYAELNDDGFSSRTYSYHMLRDHYVKWRERCDDEPSCNPNVAPVECDATLPSQYDITAWHYVRDGHNTLLRPGNDDTDFKADYLAHAPAGTVLPPHDDYLIAIAAQSGGYITDGWPDDTHFSKDPGTYHTALHETGHALGMMHEQKRPDATTSSSGLWEFPCYIKEASAECGDSEDHNTNEDAFDAEEDAVLLSPYDIRSIMQYPSTNMAKDHDHLPILARWQTPGAAEVNQTQPSCDYPYGMISGWKITRALELSPEDINVVLQMYPPDLGQSEPDDRFGAALAAGDFDGDGYIDLAIGAPGEVPPGTTYRTGSVYIYKGTYTGLVPWKRIDEPGANRRDDGFGSALAAGHIDDQPGAALIIGAPRARVAGGASAGQAFLYEFTQKGPVLLRTIDPSSGPFPEAPSAAGDQFGTAVAMGDFEGLGVDRIAVGAPGKGTVYEFKADGSKLKSLLISNGAGARFGQALASGNLNSDGKDDLVIGAPGYALSTVGQGAVFVNLGGSAPLARIDEPSVGTPNASGDAFGSSLAIGSFTSSGQNGIIVGAPGFSSAKGRVSIFHWSTAGATYKQTLRRSDVSGPGGDVAGARFGQAVAAIHRSGLDDLVVGAPASASSSLSGYVLHYRGDGSGTTPHVSALTYVGVDDYPGDQFGQSLAAGNFNQRAGIDVAMGAPGIGDADGWVFVARSSTEATLEIVPNAPGSEGGPVFNSFLSQDIVPSHWKGE